jgi:hypothetical protein
MKFYRAKFSFIDDDWAAGSDSDMPDSALIMEGTVIALDREPKLEYWEEIEITGNSGKKDEK